MQEPIVVVAVVVVLVVVETETNFPSADSLPRCTQWPERGAVAKAGNSVQAGGKDASA